MINQQFGSSDGLVPAGIMALPGPMLTQDCVAIWCHWTTQFHQPSRTRFHDDVIKWKHFPRYWPVVHRWPVNSPHKGKWRAALMFSLICAWINGWINNREAGDLRRHRAHYDVTVMSFCSIFSVTPCGREWSKFHRTIRPQPMREDFTYVTSAVIGREFADLLIEKRPCCLIHWLFRDTTKNPTNTK